MSPKTRKTTDTAFSDGRRLATVLVTAVLLTLLSPTNVKAEPRCTDVTDYDDDVLLLSWHGCASAFKSSVSDYFRFEKKHWDEGWGWIRCNSDRPFGKMLNAAWLLAAGIEPWEEYPRAWHLLALHQWIAENATIDSTNVGANLEISPDPGAYEPAVYSSAGLGIQLAGINDTGDLIYYHGGEFSGDWFADNITRRIVPASDRQHHRLKAHPVYETNVISGTETGG